MLNMKDVSKKFNNKIILDKINLEIRSSQVVGLVGVNGSGKTTLMKSILQLMTIDGGEIKMMGNVFSREHFKSIGSMIETPIFHNNLTGFENIKIHKKMIKTKIFFDTDFVLKLVGLSKDDYLNKKVKNYSLGMKQKLGFIRAVIHQPKLLILDEPTNGLDPIAIVKFREAIKLLATKYNISTLLSSHLLTEVEQTCDSIYFLSNQKLVRNEFKSSWAMKIRNLDVELDFKHKISNEVIIIEELSIPVKQFIANNLSDIIYFKQSNNLEEYFIDKENYNG